MPCYRCGARQTDPVRGASPWKRGVRAAAQVLVCPECQRVHDWTAELDACGRCGSTMLVRTLGETQCRACGTAGESVAGGVSASTAGGVGGPEGSDGAARVPGEVTALSEDVSAALERLFSRSRSP